MAAGLRRRGMTDDVALGGGALDRLAAGSYEAADPFTTTVTTTAKTTINRLRPSSATRR